MRKRVGNQQRRHAAMVRTRADAARPPRSRILPAVRPFAALLVVAAVLAGCGSQHKSLPAGCTEGPLAIQRALKTAPGPVKVDGTPISGCFTHNATSDDLQILGTYMLAAAQGLADQANAGDRAAALRLGYLVGAAERGSARNGVSGELVRRLQAETDVQPGQRQALNAGLQAGRAGG
jgi:hypothetical protein